LHSDTIFSIVTVSVGGTRAGECRGRQRGGDGPGRSYTAIAMPIYEYRCDNGHVFEVIQRMTDDPVVSCQTCEAPVQRVFHPVAVHFKGSGFYSTDYGTRNRSRELEKSAKDGADKTEAKGKEKAKAKEKGSSDGKKGGDSSGTASSASKG
jgi:putative FmdB family regulatory protein